MSGDAGAAGAPDVNAAGTSGAEAAGAAGVVEAAGAAGESACPTTGIGALVLDATGLPAGVDPSFELRGSDGSVVAASELDALPAGPYTLTAQRVYDTDPIVRSAFEPEAVSVTLCHPASSQDYSVEYRKIASSNQLWTLNGPGAAAALLGFASDTLAVTGTPPASSAVDAPVGNSLAFDFDGNLWTGGATVGDPDLQRFPASTLSSATAAPDLALTVAAIDCVPAIRGIAVDGGSSGNRHVRSCFTQARGDRRRSLARAASVRRRRRALVAADQGQVRQAHAGLARGEQRRGQPDHASARDQER